MSVYAVKPSLVGHYFGLLVHFPPIFIICFSVTVDHSRVKLKEKPGVECSDYINANYITVSL